MIAAATVVAAGAGAGAFMYWPAKRELDEAVRADTAVTGRFEALTVLEYLADAQLQLIAASPPKRLEYLGRFKQAAVEGASRATRALQEAAEVNVRAVLVEYDERFDKSDNENQLSGGRSFSFSRGPISGQLPPFDFRFEDHHDFCRAARKLMDWTSPTYCIGDIHTSDPDIMHLRLPENADHYVRARVTVGERKFGLLCVDTWGTDKLDGEDIEPILAIAKLLAAGIAAVEFGLPTGGGALRHDKPEPQAH